MTNGKSLRPAFCPFIYTDGRKLFLEFDGMVLDFVYTEAGLNRALKHIPNIANQPGYLTGGHNIADKVLKAPKGYVAKKNPPVTRKVRKSKNDSEVAKFRELLKGESADALARMLKEGKLK